MHTPPLSGQKQSPVTGGTGSFGNFVVRRLLESGPGEVRVFSRDDEKMLDTDILTRPQGTKTHETWVRFLLTLNDADDLVLYAAERGRAGDVFVHEASAACVQSEHLIGSEGICRLIDRADSGFEAMEMVGGEFAKF